MLAHKSGDALNLGKQKADMLASQNLCQYCYYKTIRNIPHYCSVSTHLVRIHKIKQKHKEQYHKGYEKMLQTTETEIMLFTVQM